MQTLKPSEAKCLEQICSLNQKSLMNVMKKLLSKYFTSTVYTKDYEARCDAIKNSVLNKLESIGNTVLARSADFA